MHKPELKARVALEAIKGEMTMAQMIKKFDVQQPQITQCLGGPEISSYSVTLAPLLTRAKSRLKILKKLFRNFMPRSDR